MPENVRTKGVHHAQLPAPAARDAAVDRQKPNMSFRSLYRLTPPAAGNFNSAPFGGLLNRR